MSDDSVTAVILAAGEGRRLEPLTNRRPKPMVPVANRPLLEHVVEAVAAAGVDRIALVVGYRQERIRNHFGDGDDWGVTIEYVEQSTQLGTGHAVLQAEPVVDGPFVVLNGDRIVDPGVVSRVRDRARDGAHPAMAVTTAAHPRTYGVVRLDGDRVTGIDEKPEGPVATNRINAGVYAFSPAVFDAIRETHAPGELAITATLNELASAGDLTAVRYDGRWLDVSNLWDLLTVNAALIGESGRTAATDPAVGESATVADDVALAGNVRVGPNVTIGGSTAIGSNATIEASAVVENAVVFPDAVIGPGAVVRDAVVAGNARIGPNATVAGGPATVVVGDAVHRDIDLGGVVGDNTVVGGGATLTDGAVVGDDVRADAGVVIDGRVESGAVVRRG
ncbi:MAG: sugar phosphate nucleotidyltransferase [Halorubrum sp.]